MPTIRFEIATREVAVHTRTSSMTAPSAKEPYLMRAPQTEPPYDTEEWRPEVSRAELGLGVPIQGTLALAIAPAALPATARHGRPLRLVLDPDDDFETFEPPERTPRAQLPDPTGLAFHLAVAMGEALAGIRPADQLARSFSEPAFDALRAAVPARKLAARRSAGVLPPLARPRIRVRSLRSSEPADGAAEVCAHVQVGERARAVALRLEGLAGRWVCTQVQIG